MSEKLYLGSNKLSSEDRQAIRDKTEELKTIKENLKDHPYKNTLTTLINEEENILRIPRVRDINSFKRMSRELIKKDNKEELMKAKTEQEKVNDWETMVRKKERKINMGNLVRAKKQLDYNRKQGRVKSSDQHVEEYANIMRQYHIKNPPIPESQKSGKSLKEIVTEIITKPKKYNFGERLRQKIYANRS